MVELVELVAVGGGGVWEKSHAPRQVGCVCVCVSSQLFVKVADRWLLVWSSLAISGWL